MFLAFNSVLYALTMIVYSQQRFVTALTKHYSLDNKQTASCYFACHSNDNNISEQSAHPEYTLNVDLN